MTLLSAIALAFSIYLTVHSLADSSAGCIAGSSCDTVLGSRWSKLFGIIPVAGLSVCLYTLVFTCCCFLFNEKSAEISDLSWKILTLASGAIIGCAIWFFFLQAFRLKAFCPICMATHLTGVILSFIVLRRFSRHRLPWAASGVLAAAAVALIQSLVPAETKAVTGYSPEPLPVVPLNEAPMIGDRNAATVIELLFDYQCSHCRKVHGMLEDYSAAHPDVAFALCPSPLEASCNPYVPRYVQNFKGSCIMAKAALAVWFSDPSGFSGFDEWLWNNGNPESAMEEAGRLIGKEELQSALNDSRITDYLGICSEIFGRTVTSGKAGIPRLILGEKWIIPEVDTYDELSNVINELLQ